MEIIWTDLAIQQLDEIAEYVQDNFGNTLSPWKKWLKSITSWSEAINTMLSVV